MSGLSACAQNTSREIGALDIYTSKWLKFSLSTRSIENFEGEPKLFEVNVVYPVKKLGRLKLNEDSFSKIYNEALNYDSSGDPFLGSGISFLIRTGSDEWFDVFYEYHKDNPEAINRKRIILNKLGKISDRVNDEVPLLVHAKIRGGCSFSVKLISDVHKLLVKEKGSETGRSSQSHK